MKYDFFISHASEDKESFVRPLVSKLMWWGYSVWYDEHEITGGDSLSRSIDRGLIESSYGLVIVSKMFMKKDWTDYEFRGLITKERKRRKVIIPVWFGVTKSKVARFSPTLADKLAIIGSPVDVNATCVGIIKAVDRNRYNGLVRDYMVRKILESRTVRKTIPVDKLVSGPIVHKTLPDHLMRRLKLVYSALIEPFPCDFGDFVDSFRRDYTPESEVRIWEVIASAYIDSCQAIDSNAIKRKAIAAMCLGLSVGRQPGVNGDLNEHERAIVYQCFGGSIKSAGMT